MHERYIQVCDQILQYKEHRDPLVKRAVIELIPTLASYNHVDFAPNYLHKTMVYLLAQLKKAAGDRTTCEWGAESYFDRLTPPSRSFPRYRARRDARQGRHDSLPRRHPRQHQRGLANARVSSRSIFLEQEAYSHLSLTVGKARLRRTRSSNASACSLSRLDLLSPSICTSCSISCSPTD